MKKEKCTFPDGIVIKPDGETELDACQYKIKQIFENVTIAILECEKCGHMEIEWLKQPNTQEISEEEFEEKIMEQARDE